MSENRRNTRRWPEIDAPEGDLKWSRGMTHVRVTDQSSEGLGLELPPGRSLAAGDHVWLRTASGVTEGIVMHVEPAGTGCHVGMARVRDFVPTDIPKWRWWLGMGPKPKSGDWRHQNAGPSPLVWGAFGLFLMGMGWYATQRDPGLVNRLREMMGVGAVRPATTTQHG